MKYRVEVTRIAYSRQSLEIDADSAEQAKHIALKRAPEGDFTTYEAEYEISSVELAKAASSPPHEA